jgi:hypothetical protein
MKTYEQWDLIYFRESEMRIPDLVKEIQKEAITETAEIIADIIQIKIDNDCSPIGFPDRIKRVGKEIINSLTLIHLKNDR